MWSRPAWMLWQLRSTTALRILLQLQRPFFSSMLPLQPFSLFRRA
jgi:hypothetical protein